MAWPIVAGGAIAAGGSIAGGLLADGGSGFDAYDNYTPEEQEYRNRWMAYMAGKIGQTATQYDPDTYAKAGDEFYANLDSARERFDAFSPAGEAAIEFGLSGAPAYEYDPETVSAYWQENYATPAMQGWEEFISPLVKENMAGGGNLYNVNAGRIVGREATKFYGESVTPALYNAQMAEKMAGINSLEAGRSRQSQTAANLPAWLSAYSLTEQGPERAARQEKQAQLTDAFQRFERMQEYNSPWLQYNMSTFAGTGTGGQSTAITPGANWSEIMGNVGAIAGTTVQNVWSPAPQNNSYNLPQSGGTGNFGGNAQNINWNQSIWNQPIGTMGGN
jgi:hypothetical protein